MHTLEITNTTTQNRYWLHNTKHTTPPLYTQQQTRGLSEMHRTSSSIPGSVFSASCKRFMHVIPRVIGWPATQSWLKCPQFAGVSCFWIFSTRPHTNLGRIESSPSQLSSWLMVWEITSRSWSALSQSTIRLLVPPPPAFRAFLTNCCYPWVFLFSSIHLALRNIKNEIN